MKIVGTFVLSPRLELFFALAGVLSAGEAGPQPDGARRWLDQARRRLDQSFRRRLGDAGSPPLWHRMAGLPLPHETATSPDVDDVIERLAALPSSHFQPHDDPEALQRLVVDTLRRFDRLVFAAYWRSWREELAVDAPRIDARLRALPIETKARTAFFLPSRFAPPGFIAPVDEGDTVLVALDPDRLVPLISTSAASPRAARVAVSAPRDPALIYRALGDATRYTIAGMIARQPMTSAELARRLDISKPTIAHHLRALRAAGLVGEETRGTRIVLTLDRAVLEGLSDATIAQLFGTAAAPIRRSRRPG